VAISARASWSALRRSRGARGPNSQFPEAGQSHSLVPRAGGGLEIGRKRHEERLSVVAFVRRRRVKRATASCFGSGFAATTARSRVSCPRELVPGIASAVEALTRRELLAAAALRQ